MEPWTYALAGFLRGTIAPLLVVFALAVPLWLIRRFAPRAERYIYGPLFNVFYVIGRSAGRLASRVAHHHRPSSR